MDAKTRAEALEALNDQDIDESISDGDLIGLLIRSLNATVEELDRVNAERRAERDR